MSQVTIFTTGLWPNPERNGLTAIASKAGSIGDQFQCFYTSDLVSYAKSYDVINLVGHSFGGWQSLQAARTLNTMGIVVNKLILLDPVEESPQLWNTTPQAVPSNVKRALCLQKDAGITALLAIFGIQPPSFPIIYGNTPGTVDGAGAGSVESMVVKGATWHATFPQYPDVVSLVLKELAT